MIDKPVDSFKIRNYSVVAETEVIVLSCTKSVFRSVTNVYNIDRERNCERMLKCAPILRDWAPEKKFAVTPHFKKQSFEPGELIYDLGSKSDNIYFI